MMSPNAESLILLFTNERDKLVKAYENRLSQFELKIQLLLEKQQQQWECINQETRIIKVILNLETELCKLREQLSSSNDMQTDLLAEVKILNESNSPKEISSTKNDSSDLQIESVPNAIGSTKSVFAKESSIPTSCDNAEVMSSVKVEVPEEIFGNSANRYKQSKVVQKSLKISDVQSVEKPRLQNTEAPFKLANLSNADDNLFQGEDELSNHAMELFECVNFNSNANISFGNFDAKSNNMSQNIFSLETTKDNDTVHEFIGEHVQRGEVDNSVLVETNETVAKNMDVSIEQERNFIWNTDASRYLKEPNFKSCVIEQNSESLYGNSENTTEEEFKAATNITDSNQASCSTVSGLHSDDFQICTCEECGGMFVGKKALEKHQTTKHMHKNHYKCVHCDFVTNTTKGIIQHVRFHNKKKQSSSTTGAKIFSPKNIFTKFHSGKPIHDKSKPLSCKLCSFSCTQSYLLDKHLLKHGRKHIYKCQFCGRRFPQMSHVRIHERTHTGEKPYKCKECFAAFSQLSILNKHTITQHTKEYPHRCSSCGKGFMRPGEMKKHESICANNFIYQKYTR